MPDWRLYVRENLRLRHASPQREAEAIDEIARQLEDAYSEALSSGLSAEDAERRALEHIADWTRIVEELDQTARYRDADPLADATPLIGWRSRLDSLSRDFHYAARRLRQSPVFTFIALLTLALGIGANTAIFSAINALMLRPVGAVAPNQLVAIRVDYDKLNLRSGSVSTPVFVDIRDSKEVFEIAGMATPRDFNYNGGELPERLEGQHVTWEWFEVFGAKPLLGRLFTPEEDQPQANRVVILDYRAWLRLFGGDESVVGKTIQLDQESYKVIGVMRPEFRQSNASVWVPIGLPPEAYSPRNRFNEAYDVVARLKTDVSLEQAQAYVRVLTERVHQNPRGGPFARQNGWSMSAIPYVDFALGDLKKPMFVLMGAVGFVLLIACSNVAGLMLARVSVQKREFAVQTALGATRGRLSQQTLTEAGLLVAGGSLLGIALAYSGIQALLLLAPATVTEGLSIPIDTTVLAFTTIIATVSGLLFGVAPTLQVCRAGSYEALKEGARGATTGRIRVRLRSVLVLSEIALAFILMVGASLFVRSFTRLMDVNIGFEPTGLLTGVVTLPEVAYKEPEKQIAFYRTTVERLGNIPGVSAAAAVIPMLFRGEAGGSFEIEGAVRTPGEPVPQGSRLWVSPAFFSTVQIPVRTGRTFTEQDIAGSEPVVVIDETVAQQYWPNQNPVGTRIRLTQANAPWARIVGIVGHIKKMDLATESARGVYYLPMFQQPQPFPVTGFVVKTPSDPRQLFSAIREAVRSVDPAQPIADVRTMEDRVMASLGSRRFAVILLSFFAGIALFMAALGLYGVVSYTASQRRHEMGIRMALGADRQQVLALVLSHGMRLTCIGLLVGGLGSLALARLISTQLYQISTLDPLTFVMMTLMLLAVGLVATIIPARRITKMDALEACRYE